MSAYRKKIRKLGSAEDIFKFLADKKTKILASVFVLVLVWGVASGVKGLMNGVSINDENVIAFSSSNIAAYSGKKDTITIPSGIAKANPFVPYRNIEGKKIENVPAYNLIEPPDFLNEDSDAARVMDTVVSGILYDKNSPSAILKIEGNDHLVKQGDVVNNYKVIAISQDSVTVKLGSNVYKAGIGEIISGNLNQNEVSNLSNKFGGKRG